MITAFVIMFRFTWKIVTHQPQLTQ